MNSYGNLFYMIYNAFSLQLVNTQTLVDKQVKPGYTCTSLIMVDLFISNSCYVLTRNITNPGSCLLYYLLFLPPVYLFFSYSFNRLTLLFERRKKKGTHPFSSFYPASRAFLVFS